MTEEIDNNDLIQRFKKFESASYTKFKDLFEQIKLDRKFISGDQVDTLDHTLTDASIGEGVPLMSLNVVKNAIRTVVNTYLPNTYKCQQLLLKVIRLACKFLIQEFQNYCLLQYLILYINQDISFDNLKVMYSIPYAF